MISTVGLLIFIMLYSAAIGSELCFIHFTSVSVRQPLSGTESDISACSPTKGPRIAALGRASLHAWWSLVSQFVFIYFIYLMAKYTLPRKHLKAL